MSTTRVTADLVRNGEETLDKIWPNTVAKAGSIKDAVNAGGQVHLTGDMIQVTEQNPPAGSDVKVSGVITNDTKYFTFVPKGNFVRIKGGRYVNNNTDTPASVIRTPNDSGIDSLFIEDMDITGNVQEDKAASYAIDLRGVTNCAVRDITARRYTGALHLNGCRDIRVENLRAQNMVFIPSENAGGYGVLLGDCRNVLIDGLHFRAVAAEGAKGRHAFYVSAGASGSGNSNIVLKNIFATYQNLQHRWMYTGVLRTCSDVTIDNLHTYGGNAGLGLNPENGPLVNVKLINSYIQVNQIDNETPAYGMATSDFGASPHNSYVNFFVSNVIFDMVIPSDVTRKMTCAIRFNGRDSQFKSIKIQETGNKETAGTSPIILGASVNLLFDGILFSNRSANPAFLFEANVEGLSIRNLVGAGTIFDTNNLITYGRDISVDWGRKSQVSISAGTITKVDTDGLFAAVTVSGINCTIRFNNHVTWEAIDNATLSGAIGTIAGRNQANKELVIRCFNGATAIDFGTGSVSFYLHLKS